MLQDLTKLKILGDYILNYTASYSSYLHAIFTIQASCGCRYGDAQKFVNWLAARVSTGQILYLFRQEKTGKERTVSFSLFPDFIHALDNDFKMGMLAQSYSKAVKVVKRSGCPVVQSSDGQFTVTHVFRYIYIYERKNQGRSNSNIANDLKISESTVNHYLAKEFKFLN